GSDSSANNNAPARAHSERRLLLVMSITASLRLTPWNRGFARSRLRYSNESANRQKACSDRELAPDLRARCRPPVENWAPASVEALEFRHLWIRWTSCWATALGSSRSGGRSGYCFSVAKTRCYRRS